MSMVFFWMMFWISSSRLVLWFVGCRETCYETIGFTVEDWVTDSCFTLCGLCFFDSLMIGLLFSLLPMKSLLFDLVG